MKDENLMERLPESKALIIDSKANNTVKSTLEDGKDGRTGHYPKSAYYGSFLSWTVYAANRPVAPLETALYIIQ